MLRLNAASSLPVRCHLYVIDIDLARRVGEDSGASLTIAVCLDALECPISGLGPGRGPRLAASSHLPVGQILDLQLQAIPGVALPVERLSHGARRFDLPGAQFDLLAVAHDHQFIPLSDNPGVSHLTPLYSRKEISLGG